MNLNPNSKRKTQDAKRTRERGSATVLVFALVVILCAIMAGNQLVLHSLKRELKLIEQQQLKKFQPPKARPAVPQP